MKSREEKRLDLVLREYSSTQISRSYLWVYTDENVAPRAFASIHERMDGLLKFINSKAPNGHEGHYNAEESRHLLALLDELRELRRSLAMVGHELVIRPEYNEALDQATTWLEPSGGSTIPAGFTPVDIDPYAPALWLEGTAIIQARGLPTEMKSIGAGSYATVQKFIDRNHGMPLARKKLKPEVDERERQRFRREFDLMKDLRHPYILEVYRFNESDWSYVMEFCESTLEGYIAKRNNDPKFGFDSRKRIALQFLYGLNYIHIKGHFHRDLSPNNVLLRVYDDGAVLVKLSDFGLAKRRGSEFTTTETEMKGTKLDPALDKFKEFDAVNDIYSAGFVLQYIFTGRKGIGSDIEALDGIIHRCVDTKPSRRFQGVREIITEVEALEQATKTGADQGLAPATLLNR